MERRKRFFAGLVAAGLTFGALMAFVGPKHFNHYRGCHGYAQHHQCDGQNNYNNNCTNCQHPGNQPQENKVDTLTH